MSNEMSSSWVPDKVPSSEQRKVNVSLNDSRLVRETQEIIKVFDVYLSDLCGAFIEIGFIAEHFEEGYTLVEADSMGKRVPVDLNAQKYIPNPAQPMEIYDVMEIPGLSAFKTSPKLDFVLQGMLIEKMMCLANRYSTTGDGILRKMFILGINIARAENDSNKTYIIEGPTGDNQITIFPANRTIKNSLPKTGWAGNGTLSSLN